MWDISILCAACQQLAALGRLISSSPSKTCFVAESCPIFKSQIFIDFFYTNIQAIQVLYHKRYLEIRKEIRSGLSKTAYKNQGISLAQEIR